MGSTSRRPHEIPFLTREGLYPHARPRADEKLTQTGTRVCFFRRLSYPRSIRFPLLFHPAHPIFSTRLNDLANHPGIAGLSPGVGPVGL